MTKVSNVLQWTSLIDIKPLNAKLSVNLTEIRFCLGFSYKNISLEFIIRTKFLYTDLLKHTDCVFCDFSIFIKVIPNRSFKNVQ